MQYLVVDQVDTLDTDGWERGMADDEYADALMAYWAAVKHAEREIAPFFRQGSPLTPEQRDAVAAVVAQVSAAEDVYLAALEAAGNETTVSREPCQAP